MNFKNFFNGRPAGLISLVFLIIVNLLLSGNMANGQDRNQDKPVSKVFIQVEEAAVKPAVATLHNVEKTQLILKSRQKSLHPNSPAGQTQGQVVIMQEDFEGNFPGDNGWTLYINGNSGSPGYGYTWGAQSYRKNSGSMAGWCADAAYRGQPDINPPGPYPDNMNAWMVFGPFDLSDATAAMLEFYCWVESEESYDGLKYYVSKNDTNWYGYFKSGDKKSWTQTSMDLTNVYTLGNLCGESQVWIAFVFQSNDNVTYEGAYVDDIVLTKETGAGSGLNLVYNQIESSNFPVIDSYVTVSDDQGNSISGLTAANFNVQEDGHTESPVTVTSMGGGNVPIAAALVIDRSGSMGGTAISDAKAAAITFVNQMAANDRAAVISFSSGVTVDQAFTSDKNLLISAINGISSGGGTAIYDAVIEAVNQINTQTGRKAILLLSDGDDTSSSSSLQDAINTANQSGVPIFAIGLGLSSGSSGEQAMQQLGNNTGGAYYYAPTSSDLEQIYQLISQQLANQYKLTYTTHNSTADGTTRTVQITANYSSNSDTKSRTYIAPSSGSGVPIFPSAASPQVVDNEFWVDIKVGDAAKPVTNLFGVSFVLNYTQTGYIDVVTPYSGTVIPGSFLGTDLVFYQSVDDGMGKVSVGVSRKTGQGGVSGNGSVLRVKFIASSGTPNNTVVQFSITDIVANDPNGSPLNLTPGMLSITIQAGVGVWPGDTNNNGLVNQADVLPLGLYWNKTESARPGASISWTGQNCQLWSTPLATYADATGDGVVNQADVLPIGLNWGKTHSSHILSALYPSQEKIKSAQTPIIAPETNPPAQAPDQEFFIDIMVSDVTDLFGLSFELVYDQTLIFDVIAVEIDSSFLGDDLVYYSNIEDSAGIVAVGISCKSGQTGANGNGSVVRMKGIISGSASDGSVINLSLQNITANDSNGDPLEFSKQSSTITVSTSSVNTNGGLNIPKGPGLSPNYPNPFNAQTIIRYKVESAATVKVTVYNSSGQEIRSLVQEYKTPGYHQVSWDGRDNRGNCVTSGIYFCCFNAGDFSQTQKMLYIR